MRCGTHIIHRSVLPGACRPVTSAARMRGASQNKGTGVSTHGGAADCLGDSPARTLNDWIPDVYRKACEHAHQMLYRWQSTDRPDTASLVDRAVCELLDWGQARCRSREHALALLIQKMGQVLIDLVRERGAYKRGGAGRAAGGERPFRARVPLEELPDPLSGDRAQLLALNEAMSRLDELSPRLKTVVGLRFLVGLSVEETARELGLAPASVKRDTQLATAWLYSQLSDGDGRAADES